MHLCFFCHNKTCSYLDTLCSEHKCRCNSSSICNSSGCDHRDFDCIYTGDLGLVGSQMLRELLAAEGLLLKNHADCGCLLYDAGEQRVKSGGSGAGCCAAVLCAHILPKLLRRGSRRVLFIATGALMSQTTFLQKESIPAVAHLVELTAPEKES